MPRRYRYPRTLHLPWSPGAQADDRYLDALPFEGQAVVVTEKLDGENTTMARDYLHARSPDGRHHPSRDWVKGLWGQIRHEIPPGWRLCGENLYARHSIAYDELPSYFFLFSIWDEQNRALAWDESVEWAALLGLHTVPVLWRGLWDEAAIRALTLDLAHCEGYVVRTVTGFAYDEFPQHVAKWVRPHHVQTDEHWMHAPIVPNQLREEDE